MFLKEYYGASFDLKYRYLEPTDAQESAALVKMAELYPEYFKLVSERQTTAQRYRIELRIKNAEKKEI